MIVPEAGLGARVFPADLAAFLVDYTAGRASPCGWGRGWRGSTGARLHASCARPSGGELVAEVLSPGSVSAGVSWRSRPACAWTRNRRGQGVSAPASPTSMPPGDVAKLRESGDWAHGCAWSTKTRPTRWPHRRPHMAGVRLLSPSAVLLLRPVRLGGGLRSRGRRRRPSRHRGRLEGAVPRRRGLLRERAECAAYSLDTWDRWTTHGRSSPSPGPFTPRT